MIVISWNETLDEKVKVLSYQCVSELKAFLGLTNGKFLPNLSTILDLLYSLLHKDRKWNWKSGQEEAFKIAKDMIRSSTVLAHYDAMQKLVLTCDASPILH